MLCEHVGRWQNGELPMVNSKPFVLDSHWQASHDHMADAGPDPVRTRVFCPFRRVCPVAECPRLRHAHLPCLKRCPQVPLSEEHANSAAGTCCGAGGVSSGLFPHLPGHPQIMLWLYLAAWLWMVVPTHTVVAPPEQVHLALGATPDTMSVQWATMERNSTYTPVVVYGLSGVHMRSVAKACASGSFPLLWTQPSPLPSSRPTPVCAPCSHHSRSPARGTPLTSRPRVRIRPLRSASTACTS